MNTPNLLINKKPVSNPSNASFGPNQFRNSEIQSQSTQTMSDEFKEIETLFGTQSNFLKEKATKGSKMSLNFDSLHEIGDFIDSQCPNLKVHFFVF